MMFKSTFNNIAAISRRFELDYTTINKYTLYVDSYIHKYQLCRDHMVVGFTTTCVINTYNH